MSKIITVDMLSDAIAHELDDYNKVVIEGTKKEAKEAMDELVKETKATAPKRTGRYKRAITSKKSWENSLGVEYIWYVKSPHYRLSHLLENGHAKKNGGRTKAFHFIKKASDPIIDRYIRAVEEACKNG